MCLDPGDILHDRYKIIDILGQGGFATTYTAVALAKPGNPPCAIKEIARPQSTEPLVLQQAQHLFQKEVQALRLLGQDSRIPEYYDSFQSDENGNFYLVQEYIEGDPLSEELATGAQWTQENTVALLREIMEILRFVHDRKVIHRDLKPSNLIRRKLDGTIVLIDFGAVKGISNLAFQGIEGNTCIASAYDATRALIKALEMQDNPSREGMQKTLSDPKFSAEGATGSIQFNSPHNGDRKNPPSELVHIVECRKERFGLAFVPIKYPTATAAGLECD